MSSARDIVYLIHCPCYRFELLQRTTQIHQQPLIQPLSVETSAALELVMAEHLDTFTANGFKLAVDLEAHAGRRVQLLSVPFSKSVAFGVDDVNELASMISEHYGGAEGSGGSDSTSQRVNKSYLALKNDDVRVTQKSSGPGGVASTPMASAGAASEDGEFTFTAGADFTQPMDVDAANFGTNAARQTSQFRLPKLVAMYASRACRSAIMIGTALKAQEMQRVVAKLERVEQPWNCPHGRPTLRHLVDLTPIREHSSHREQYKGVDS